MDGAASSLLSTLSSHHLNSRISNSAFSAKFGMGCVCVGERNRTKMVSESSTTITRIQALVKVCKEVLEGPPNCLPFNVYFNSFSQSQRVRVHFLFACPWFTTT